LNQDAVQLVTFRLEGTAFESFQQRGWGDFVIAKKIEISNDRGQPLTQDMIFGLFQLVSKE